MDTTHLRIEDPDVSEVSRSEAELARLEPHVDSDVIHRLVEQTYEDLMPAKVRSFLPILIVHEVRDILHGRQGNEQAV